MNGIKSRHGSTVIAIVVMLAAATIVTAASVRHSHQSARHLQKLHDTTVARETAAGAAEKSKAAVYNKLATGAAIPEQGLMLQGEGWSAAAYYCSDSGHGKIETTAYYGLGKAKLTQPWERLPDAAE